MAGTAGRQITGALWEVLKVESGTRNRERYLWGWFPREHSIIRKERVMGNVLPILIFVGVAVLVVLGLVVWIKQGKKRALALRSAFEVAHGLKGSERPGEFGPIYRATGTVRGVEIHIESEPVRSDRGWRQVTRVRAKGDRDVGSLVAVRRALADNEAGAAAHLPQQELGAPAFDDRFRTLCATAEEAGALLTPELTKRLAAHVQQPLFGIQSLKIAGAEATMTMGSSLANGLIPEQRKAVDEALEVVLTLVGR